MWPNEVFASDLDGDGDKDMAVPIDNDAMVSVFINLLYEPEIFCLLRGDFNRDDQFDILDIDDFIDYLFRGGLAPPCEEEVDVDDNGQADILDIDYMIDYLFRDGPEPIPCPPLP